MMKDRIYVCHTYYHVYVTCLRELNLPPEKRGQAVLLLSSMSNDFRDLGQRAEASGIFEEVIRFDEKPEEYFPELKDLKKDRGNIVRNMFQRRKFDRTLSKLEEPFVPVDFREYRDIYVYCDSDPIGYYLAGHKIRYHALEDGLDCLVYSDRARYDNRGHFRLKAALALCGFIFIQNGYSKYCIDMEVNDIDAIPFPGPKSKRKMGECGKKDSGHYGTPEEPYRDGKYIEIRREVLASRLTKEDRALLTRMFIANIDALRGKLSEAKASGRATVLILSEPLLPDLRDRKRLFSDLIRENGTVDGREGVIVIKPHPRDKLDYAKEFPEYIVLDPFFPMEILNFIDGLMFDRVVTVYTVPDSLHCVKEKIFLGNDFMDRYEAPEIHRKNEAAAAAK